MDPDESMDTDPSTVRQQEEHQQQQQHQSVASAPTAAATTHAADTAERKHVVSIEPRQDSDGYLVHALGDSITPRFKVLSLLGHGTFSTVAEVWDRHRGKRVAMKVVRAVAKYREAAKLEVRVLIDISKHDPQQEHHLLPLRKWFEFGPHLCIVMPKYGPSLFEFLRRNRYRGFCVAHVQHIAQQLCDALHFMHDTMHLVHTDLKPENVLLVHRDHVELTLQHPDQVRYPLRVPIASSVKLVDFGSATYEGEYHSRVISTRHYRAPEVVLGLGWSYPCDLWSLGCILVELLTGRALFLVHDDATHLAMMQRLLGPAPAPMLAACDSSHRGLFGLELPEELQQDVLEVKPLHEIVELARHPPLLDLVRGMLQWDPACRCTAAQALAHPFFADANKMPLNDPRPGLGLGWSQQYIDFIQYWLRDRFAVVPPPPPPSCVHIERDSCLHPPPPQQQHAHSATGSVARATSAAAVPQSE